MAIHSVLKRNRELEEDFDLDKLLNGVKKATGGLVKDVEEFVHSALKLLPSCVASSQIRDALISTAVNRISLETPEWDKIAVRLFLQKIYREVSLNLDPYTNSVKCYSESDFDFRDCLRNNIGLKKITPKLDKVYTRECSRAIDGSRNYQFTYLGVKTLYDKYLLKAEDKTALETPQQMFMGIALFLSLKDTYAGSYTIKYYDLMSTFKAMVATPILANARTPRFQLNSCYVGSCGDSIESIFTSFKDMAMISKNGGGIGWDFSCIRGMGSSIDGITGVGGGIIPWLKITNDVAIAVDQLGTRKGAIAAWCEIWHIDIEDFIELRKNSGDERRRAHDLFPALWICDLFMNRVLLDGDWVLFDPYYFKGLNEVWGFEFEKIYKEYEQVVSEDPSRKGYKVIKAKELWKKILTQIFETGLPFVGFKDTANGTNMNRNTGIIRSSNLCTEIFQNTKPSDLELKVVFETNRHEEFGEHVRNYPLSSELTVPQEFVHPLMEEPKYMYVTDLRPGDTIKNRSEFTKSEVKFLAKESSNNGETAVCTLGSVNISKLEAFREDGTFDPNCYIELRRTVSLLVRMLNNVIDLNSYPIETARNSQNTNRAIGIGVMGEAELMVKSGIHYGSDEHKAFINNIMESISYNAIEGSYELVDKWTPAYKNFKLSDWSDGIIPRDKNENTYIGKSVLSVPGILRDSFCDWNYLSKMVQEKGLRNGYLLAIAPTSSISILCGTTQSIEPYYDKFWYEENISGLVPSLAPSWSEDKAHLIKTAYEINPETLIELAAIRQKWIDQGQSLNLFVSPKITGKELSDLYFKAWTLGLKSIYYCRTKSTEITSESMVSCSIDCEACQ